MNAGFVTVRLGQQHFGLPVLDIRDVLRQPKITPVPLAPGAIAGLSNLRGSIVTAIDLRMCFGLAPRDECNESTSIVVERDGELYALIVDAIGDVLQIEQERREPMPAALDVQWREVAAAVYPDECGLIVLLDIGRLLDIAPKLRAAS